MTLSDLPAGHTGVITAVSGANDALRRHLLAMGLTPGARVTFVKAAPLGDPLQFRVRGYLLTLRRADAGAIGIAPHLPPRRAETPAAQTARLRARPAGPAIPAGAPLSLALVGNPNCGKTTLFNRLTGAHQRVGNFPGVTVDRKEGLLRGRRDVHVIDLPGMYSLSPFGGEERIARAAILKNRPDGIIHIIDATNLERSLLLTFQLSSLGIPMVIALNMMDEVRAGGGRVDVKRLEESLGIPALPISAAKNEGIDALADRAIQTARARTRPGRVDFLDGDGRGGGEAGRHLRDLRVLLEPAAARAGVPAWFAALRLSEGDEELRRRLKLTPVQHAAAKTILQRMEQDAGCERETAVAAMRFACIERICADCAAGPSDDREERLDRLLTGRFTAFPVFILLMALIFYLTFGPLGGWLSDGMAFLLSRFSDGAARGLSAAGVHPVLCSLVIDGVFAGVGSVLSFLPVITVLFLLLSLLEDSGYMARVAFIMDRPLHAIGLSGHSFVPLLLGFGCTVPAVMATRTLPRLSDRRRTVFLLPFMSCSAKLPLYALLTAAFFSRTAAAVMPALYLLGIAVGVGAAALLRSKERGTPAAFVLELPPYRLPGLKNVARLVVQKAKDFLTKAFTVIFLFTVIVWALQTFTPRFSVAARPEDSLLAACAGWFAPLFYPLGIYDWRVITALFTGVVAKESVVSTLTVLCGDLSQIGALFTPQSAAVFLVFSLLYTPCIAAIASVKREIGLRYAVRMVLFQCATAWLIAFFVRLMLSLLDFLP